MTFDYDNPAFDDDSRPAPSEDFRYDEIDGPEPEIQRELPDVNQFLLALFNGGHRDAIPVRLAALATLTGAYGFETVAAAARQVGVHASAVSRARKAIIRELSTRAQLRKVRARHSDSRGE
jgi:hypothetical protein